LKKNKRVTKAFIMAAGYGTRLEPMTFAVPKPMVPIVNKPTMLHNIELLRRNGIRQITANIHYHPEQIVNYFADGDDFGVDLTYSFEEELMGTAGGVWRMGRVVNKINETFLVLSSDALTDVNLQRLIDFHKKKKALATVALSPVKSVEHFGVVKIDDDNRLLKFQEKPKKEEAISNLVNTGIYVFEPEILDMIPQNKLYDFGKDLFPRLMEENIPVYGYHMIEYWSDVGTLDAYREANYDAMHGTVRINIPGKKVSACVWIGKNCRIDESVKFEGCVIVGDRCEIRAGAFVKDSIIGKMGVVGVDTKISDSIIWSDTFISKNSDIKESVVGNWCFISEGVKINPKCIISNRCKIHKETKVAERTMLKPNEIL